MPIFMIGTQRSGSNLLRLMLNELPDIAAPHPPHILQRLMPLLPGYGDLEREENFRLLVDDVCRLVELNPVPWEGVSLDRAAVARRCRNHSLVAVFGAVYDLAAEAWGKRSWCCKSLANIQYLDEIEAYFGSEARYLYLYRDGRDVAVSFRKAVVGEKHFYHIAREWAGTQRLALRFRENIPANRFFSLRYEDLVSDPETAMRDLCRFLGVPFRRSMLEFYKSEEARRAAEASALWGNVVKPVMRDNTGKFRREAAEEDIRIFESVAGDVLDALGYERSCVPRGQEQAFSEEDIRGFDAVNAWLKDEIRRKTDSADLERRDRQAALLAEIRARQGAAEGSAPPFARAATAAAVNPPGRVSRVP
jgi:hypothetical protein